MPTSFADFLKKFYAVLPLAISDKLERLFKSWATKKLDGKITVPEFLLFVKEAIQEAMALIDSLAADGKIKKAIILEFAGLLFDAFAPYIVGALAPKSAIVLLILWLLGVTPENVKGKFLLAVDWMIEAIYNAKFAKA